MASGHVNRATGRTGTDQTCNFKKVLVNSKPSTHGGKRTLNESGARWCSGPLRIAAQQPQINVRPFFVITKCPLANGKTCRVLLSTALLIY